ncbi:Tetratricopeptide repeat protein 9C [Grifola frondosa]|uniref:Tetratricopeptide repeat protein 9C n=1 Tax=Grifola frondosa TaxID=5627 RepID=A0A1C7M5W1_GRIFR|nr:Tetratricopeptide repeat protein 9C [Grifola frondosa]
MSTEVIANGDVLKKLEIAKEKKEAGDQAFKAGELQNALLSYHQSLLYLKGIDRNALQQAFGGPTAPEQPVDQAAKEKPKTEADEMMEKIYSNMSACHLKQSNWKRAVETADKALALNENNYKALFRKAKALGEQGYVEKAFKILEDLSVKNPIDAPICNAELARLRAIDKERERVHNQKLKGFLNREKKPPVDVPP